VYTTGLEGEGTMAAMTPPRVKAIWLGQDNSAVYVRLDCASAPMDFRDHTWTLILDQYHEVFMKHEGDRIDVTLIRNDEHGNKIVLANSVRFHVSDFIEVMIPLSNIGVTPSMKSVYCRLLVHHNNQLVEQWPRYSEIVLDLKL
jgi:hypothetical protein